MATLTSYNLHLNPLHETSFINSLQTLTSILQTSIGPFGKLKLLQNKQGGSVNLTSSSNRLLPLLQIKKSVILNVVLSAAKSQLQRFQDGGLYCTLLTLKLVSHAISLEYPLPLLGRLCQILGKYFVDCLNSEKNSGLDVIDFSILRPLKFFVFSILCCKPGCILSQKDRDHLCTLLLKAFLKVIPPTTYLIEGSNILFRTLEGSSPSQSHLYEGVLLQVTSSDVSAIRNDISDSLKIVVIATSFDTDVKLPFDCVRVNNSKTFSSGVLEYLKTVISKLVLDGVKVVFCQKVVHPSLKKLLHDSGVLIFSQLGTKNTEDIQHICGVPANVTLFSGFTYGTISKLQKISIGKKLFILLSGNAAPMYTILLCNYNEQSTKEMQVVCRQAVTALFRVLKSSRVCCGAGCMEIYTLHLLFQNVATNMNSITEESECSLGQVNAALCSFARSIVETCIALHQGSSIDFFTESIVGHLWKSERNEHSVTGSCACGKFQSAQIPSSAWRSVTDIRCFSDVLFSDESHIVGSLSSKKAPVAEHLSNEMDGCHYKESNVNKLNGKELQVELGLNCKESNGTDNLNCEESQEKDEFSYVESLGKKKFHCTDAHVMGKLNCKESHFLNELNTKECRFEIELESKELQVMDELSCKASAMSLSIETAAMLLMTTVYVKS